MAITPQTDLYLLKCPLESDNLNQLTFTSKNAQTTYFASLPHKVIEDITYQRRDNIIRYPDHIDNIETYNYVMYKNENYTNKWFYAFITNMRYINDGMTEITIKTDVYQTWQFDMDFKQSFIEREHVNSDKYGEHTIPESLETGEYIIDYESDFTNIGESHIVMATTISPKDGTTKVSGGTYGGIKTGFKYYIFKTDTDLHNALSRIDLNGNGDSVNSLFYIPDWISGYDSVTFDNDGIAEVSSNQVTKFSIGLSLQPGEIDGYTCKNKKCYTYPYISYLLSNNNGGSVEYHIEDFFDNGTHASKINVYGTCCPGGSIRAIPENYKMTQNTSSISLKNIENNEYGLNLGKFPIAGWNSDTYTNWLTQNALNIGFSEAMSEVNLLGGIATGNVGLAMNGVNGIFNNINQKYTHQFNSNVAKGNTNCGDVSFTQDKITFTLYRMTCKKEYIRVIDNYFSMYGYKVNSLKVPNLTGRSNWNYVKTIGANIEGNIPQKDIEELKSIFNNGVTLWHNPSTYLNYSQNNAIV